MKKAIAYSAGAIFLLGVWFLLPFVFGEYIVPFPWDVGKRLFVLLSGPAIYLHLSITLLRTVIGFILALVSGTLVGMLTGRMLFLEKSFFVPVSVIQGAPPLLWIIPLMLILGTGGAAPIGVVFFVVFPLVIINIQEGMKALDRGRLEMMKVYAGSKTLLAREFYLPGLGSHIKSIFLAGFLLALKSSITGEWFGAQSGIGRIINEYFYTFDMPSFYAVALLFILTVVFVAWLIGKLTSHLFERKQSKITPGEHARSDIGLGHAESTLIMKNVFFNFGGNVICNDISFSVTTPQTIVLTGDSGAGKTTLAKLSLGLLKPRKGKISVPTNACIIFQEDVFLPHLDCFGNACLPARKKKTPDAASRTLLALDRCGLAEYAHFFPDELSGGMSKRLAFARALVFNPDFIILDEPFNKLHKEARAELWQLYFTLFSERGIPSIIITHFPEELAGRQGLEFIVLCDGKLVKA